MLLPPPPLAPKANSKLTVGREVLQDGAPSVVISIDVDGIRVRTEIRDLAGTAPM